MTAEAAAKPNVLDRTDLLDLVQVLDDLSRITRLLNNPPADAPRARPLTPAEYRLHELRAKCLGSAETLR